MKKNFIKDLQTPVQFIKGIGPKRAEAFSKKSINTVYDLLYYFPFDYFDLTEVSKISDLKKISDLSKDVSIIGKVRSIDLTGRPPRRQCVIILGDDSGVIPLIFFQNINYFKTAYKVGDMLAVSGRLTYFMSKLQLVHPRIDRIDISEDVSEANLINTKGLIPKYSMCEEFRNARITDTALRKIMYNVVSEYVPIVEDFLPEYIIKENSLLPLQDALRKVHFPKTVVEKNSARLRLKFDEWFLFQLMLALRRRFMKVQLPGISFNIKSRLARQLVDSLPFKLTKAQIKVIKEIAEDMKSPKPMNRLLQGDVGSGKTIVALISMLIAVDNNYQVAFMAPTEILAEQHYRTIMQFLNGLNLNVRLLLGGQKKSLKENLLEEIKSGTANIVIGTHALIQEKIEFANLGLVIIDEQHRFGVEQRAELMKKAKESIKIQPDVLVMTATPIPRTLSLTVYGDLDVSVIDELPKDRKPVRTLLYSESESDKLYNFIREIIQKGQQVYIIYPLIEESEKMDLKAAVESYERFKKEIFPDLSIGLIHGRMPAEERDQVMKAFKENKINILVSTTVIEVGIDIPNATMMVIEHAERFGLSQLHQLRGRVGRGSEQSYCVLVAPNWLVSKVRRKNSRLDFAYARNFNNNNELEEQKATIRIQAMLSSNDGFKISEIDLKLRGPGDFFGTRQSGMPEFNIANVLEDGNLITLARKSAFKLVETDPQLRKDEHRLIRKIFLERMKDKFDLIQVG